MVWSDSLGTSIVLPSDRVDGDGRNYIVLGEDVPAEIASSMTAGLVFRSGAPLATRSDGSIPVSFAYWAVGITSIGALEFVIYYYLNPSGVGAPTYYRRTMLSLAPPRSNLDPNPKLGLGDIFNNSSFHEGTLEIVAAVPIDALNFFTFTDGAGGNLRIGITNYRNTPDNPATSSWPPLTVKQLASGMINIQGLIYNNTGVSVGGGTANPSFFLGTVPNWARPTPWRKMLIASLSGTQGLRIDVATDGSMTVEGTWPNGNYVWINETYYPNNS